MDLGLVMAISLLGTAAAVPLNDILRITGLRVLIGSLVVQTIAIQLYKIFLRPFYFSPLRHLPTPTNNTFFVGQLINQFKGPSPNTEYLSWMRQWPDAPFIRYLSFANSEVLLVNSLSAHKAVLQTKCYAFDKSRFFKRLLKEIAGKGLLFSVGNDHKTQRRQLVGPFSPPNIRKLYPTFREKTMDLLAYLDRAIEADFSGESGVFDAESLFTKITLDLIGVAALGVNFGNLSVEGSSLNFFDQYHNIFNQSRIGTLITFLNAFVPLRWVPTGENHKFRRAIKEIQVMLRGVVRKRLSEIAEIENSGASVGKASKDILTFMLEAIQTGEASWSESEIVDHLFQFVTAGHETTATSLVLITAALAANPACQDRLRSEIQAAIVQNPDLDALTIEGMQYLNNFIREVLRVYSPMKAILVPREAMTDIEIDGVLVPKGTGLIVVPQVIHENPLVWGEDAAEFKPERWEDLAGDAATPYAFETFINGPRVCPGRGFAILQIKTCLVELIRNFALLPIDPLITFQNPAISLKPLEKVKIRVKRL